MTVKISEKENRALLFLQLVYRNLSVLTPQKIRAEAERIGVKKPFVDYFLEKSNFIKHDAIGDVHVYTWNMQQKSDGADVIPNIYMVRRIFDDIRAAKQRVIERRADEKADIESVGHPVFRRKVHFKIDKFARHMHQAANEWTHPSFSPSAVMNEIGLGMDTLTVMCLMKVLLTRGTGRNRSYKWNPFVKMCDALVFEICDQRAAYVADKNSVVAFDAPHDQPAAVPVEEPQSDAQVEQCETAEPQAKTETPEPGIKKKRAFSKVFRWTKDEEWVITTGLAEGLDYKEIAALLGRSEGSVAGKIHWMRERNALVSGVVDSVVKSVIKVEDAVQEVKEMASDAAYRETKDEKPKGPGPLKRLWNSIFGK